MHPLTSLYTIRPLETPIEVNIDFLHFSKTTRVLRIPSSTATQPLNTKHLVIIPHGPPPTTFSSHHIPTKMLYALKHPLAPLNYTSSIIAFALPTSTLMNRSTYLNKKIFAYTSKKNGHTNIIDKAIADIPHNRSPLPKLNISLISAIEVATDIFATTRTSPSPSKKSTKVLHPTLVKRFQTISQVMGKKGRSL